MYEPPVFTINIFKLTIYGFLTILENVFPTFSTAYVHVGVSRHTTAMDGGSVGNAGAITDQSILLSQKKKAAGFISCGLFRFCLNLTFNLNYLKPSDTQERLTDAQIGAVPNKYLFCHCVRFHGGAIFCLFSTNVKSFE